ncbi:DUF1737 domain-containing protein [Occultella glacieicola]|uniref:DUF1737 domain-containing protein n=1 Tax=Occultella glacieicola TaxID=2518684 RepID=A0ABY2E4F7_9MICO|nr:DUF1737 domain-containing protein [Occultella glacieicola]TDE91638.1 DUF1737 domain-containing protein [Occultella glacieicola]
MSEITEPGAVPDRPARPDRPDDQPARHTYRLLTGPDDAAFCGRVSDALAEGYRLYGSPSVTFNGSQVIAAQAVVLPQTPEGEVRFA